MGIIDLLVKTDKKGLKVPSRKDIVQDEFIQKTTLQYYKVRMLFTALVTDIFCEILLCNQHIFIAVNYSDSHSGEINFNWQRKD